MALEATSESTRPQHVKEIERRLKSSRADSGRSDGATVSGKYLHGASENKGAPTATIGDGLVRHRPNGYQTKENSSEPSIVSLVICSRIKIG